MRIGSLSEKDGPVYKITDFSKEKKEAEASLSMVYKSLGMTEYVKKGTDKGEAVGKLASMLNISKEDILERNKILFDPENLITTVKRTHDAIHYGDSDLLRKAPIERSMNDTCPWKH